jgi:ABC-type branched-subunit amino acid transport system ATPase component
MTEILKISGLVGGYVSGLKILRGVDLTLREGEALGIIGLNGSGKSTLGRAVMNLLPWRQGSIMFEGKNIMDVPTDALALNGIAIMQQGGQVFRELSVYENLQIAFGHVKDKTFVEELKSIIPLLTLPVSEQKARMADKLSGGQRHQLALAMTLAQQPRLVILDEPSAGLSPKSVESMYEILEAVRKRMNVSIILIEQNINKAIQFCDRSLLIQQGVIAKEFCNKDIVEVESVMFNR